MQDNQFKAPTIEELLKSYYDQTPVMMRDVPQTPIAEIEPPQEPVEQIPQPVVAPQPIIPPKQAVSPEEIQGILASPSQPVPAESPSEAERLQDLLAQSRKSRALTEGLANVSEGIKRAASAYAGRGLTQIKPDVSMEEKMRAGAERDFKEGIDEFQASRKLQQEKDAEDARKRMESPESEESKRYREFYAKTLKMDIPENVTAAMLQDKFGALSNLAARGSGETKEDWRKEESRLNREQRMKLAEANRKIRIENEANKRTQKFQDDVRSSIKDMTQKELWKGAEKSLATIPTIKTLLTDAYNQGGQSLSMLGPKVAKGIADEVGVLTEQDVTRYVKNPTLIGGMKDTLKKATTGKISKTSYDNLTRLLDIAKQSAEDRMNQAIDREAKYFAKREKIPLDEAKNLFYENSPDLTEEKEESVQFPKEVFKDGKKAIVKTEAQLKDAIDKGWK